jgi:hypothetical protein
MGRSPNLAASLGTKGATTSVPTPAKAVFRPDMVLDTPRFSMAIASSGMNRLSDMPTSVIKMIAAGEESGQVDRVLGYMSDYYLDLKRTRQDFISQITAPVIQLLLAIAIICGMIFINGFFQAGGPGEKPFDITGVGLRGGKGVLIFLSILMLIAVVLGTMVVGVWKNWFNCHQTLVPLVRKVPVIGPVFTNTAMSRLSMTLSMMLGAGVEAKRSVRDAVLSTGNHYYIAGLPDIEPGHSSGFSSAPVSRSSHSYVDDPSTLTPMPPMKSSSTLPSTSVTALPCAWSTTTPDVTA